MRSKSDALRNSTTIVVLAALIFAYPASADEPPITAAQVSSNGTDPSSSPGIAPLTTYPIAPETFFQRVVLGDGADETRLPGDGIDATTAADPKLIYSNTRGNLAVALGAGSRFADDLALAARWNLPTCRIRWIEFPVVGRVAPGGVGGPYTVDFALYSSCPGLAGTPEILNSSEFLIAGTSAQAVFPDDAPRLISLYLGETGVAIPTGVTSVWLGVTFNRANAGIVLSGPAENGFSCDLFDYPGSKCNSYAGGYPEHPFGAMNARIFGNSDCNYGYIGYRANRPSGPTFNPGLGITLTDDIELGGSSCRMIAYEVAARGTSAYTFDIRPTCNSEAIPGTTGVFAIPPGVSEVRLLRKTFHPPIALPRQFSFAASISAPTGGVVVSGQQPCWGSTEDLFQLQNDQGCTDFDLPSQLGEHAALNITITCDGTEVEGACCDMAFPDASGESVCREVPRMNCPWPWNTGLKPDWVEGASCDSQPFPFPCGASVCCMLDAPCRNLSADDCAISDPVERPRRWYRGEYCSVVNQHCPFGDCAVARAGPLCDASACQDMVCGLDRWCCDVEWDPLCVRLSSQFCDYVSHSDYCSNSTSLIDRALEIPVNAATIVSNRWARPDEVGFGCDPAPQLYYRRATVWLTFLATYESVDISTCASSPPANNTLLSVYAANGQATPNTCPPLRELACSDDVPGCGDGLGSRAVVAGLVVGERYYVQVGTLSNDESGVLQIDVESPAPLLEIEASGLSIAGNDQRQVTATSLRKSTSRDGNPGDRGLDDPLVPGVEARQDGSDGPPLREGLHREYYDDPWVPRSAADAVAAIPHCGPWVWNGYASVQVNVDSNACNLVGDAANEPSMAVVHNDPRRIAIGWRQFDSVASNYRKAGWGFSRDYGQTWTFGGTLQGNTWRSDPVLASDPEGGVRYYSIEQSFRGTLFTSNNGGESWDSGVAAWGGDKPWMAIDKSDSVGRGFVYVQWNLGPTFSRSADGGIIFDAPVGGVGNIGTLSVDWSGAVIVAADGRFGRSTNARVAGSDPTFFMVGNPAAIVPWGGSQNPSGILGQPWVDSDHSTGPRRGWIYIMSPLAVFSRSTDGGSTWSLPNRLNVESPSWTSPWFGVMSVAPNGRIDAAWLDTTTGCATTGPCSRLYYSSSFDGGDHWTGPTAVSHPFDSHVGWPNQQKIGDYYHMVSDNNGANIAYAATFNGEQDVYFLRVGPLPDCNENGIPDDEDIRNGLEADCDENIVPDACQLDLDQDGLVDGCDEDIDGDGVSNDADACDYTPLSTSILSDGRPRADATGDCLLTLRDYWRFHYCLLNGRRGYPAPHEACIRSFDLDENGSIDMRDFAEFSNAMSGFQR